MKRAITRCILPAFFLTLAFTGCASTGASKSHLPSFTDPDFLGRSYTRLAVHYATDDLGYRKAVEAAIVDQLRENNVGAHESGSIIPPTRAWDSAGLWNALLSARIDGYLRIVETDRSTDTYHVPMEQTTKVKREAEQKQTAGSGRRGETAKDSSIKVKEVETITTTTTGGYTQEIMRTRFRIELIDVRTGRVAWIGTSAISGSISYQADDFSERIAAQLGQDGLVHLDD